MKVCQNCGCKNPDTAKFCVDCGGELTGPAPSQQPVQQREEKNKWIGPIINIIGGLISYFLCGMGQILYLKLYKRGLIFCTIGAIVMAFNLFLQYVTGGGLLITLISMVLGMGTTIYAAYDSYKCAEAINMGMPVPPLFGIDDPEAMPRSKHILIIVVFLIALIAAGALAVATVSTELESAGSLVSDVADTSTISSDDGLEIRITCPTEWSASIGDGDTSTMYEGSGDDVIEVDTSQYDVVAAAVQKTTTGSDKLKVEMIKDGEVVDKESTTDDYGVVTVSTTL